MQSTLDIAAHTNRLRYTDTRLKLIFVLITILVSSASTSPIPPFLVFFISMILVLFVAGIRPGIFFLLLLTPLFFGITTLILMSLFFGYTGHPLYTFEMLSHVFTLQKEGVNMGILVLSKTLAGSSCLFFLALTTPMTEIFGGLKWFRIPDIVIELAMMIYRYIFVLLNEAEHMWLAAKLKGEGSFRTKVDFFSMLTGTLFFRALQKGDNIFIAMNSRCYDGDVANLAYYENEKKLNIFFLSYILLFELALVYITTITQNISLI